MLSQKVVTHQGLRQARACTVAGCLVYHNSLCTYNPIQFISYVLVVQVHFERFRPASSTATDQHGNNCVMVTVNDSTGAGASHNGAAQGHSRQTWRLIVTGVQSC